MSYSSSSTSGGRSMMLTIGSLTTNCQERINQPPQRADDFSATQFKKPHWGSLQSLIIIIDDIKLFDVNEYNL